MVCEVVRSAYITEKGEMNETLANSAVSLLSLRYLPDIVLSLLATEVCT